MTRRTLEDEIEVAPRDVFYCQHRPKQSVSNSDGAKKMWVRNPRTQD